MGRGDKRGCDEDEDLVLQHVGTKQLFAKRMDRRCECKYEGKPATEKARVTPPQGTPTTAADGAAGIDHHQECQRENDGWLQLQGADQSECSPPTRGKVAHPRVGMAVRVCIRNSAEELLGLLFLPVPEE